MAGACSPVVVEVHAALVQDREWAPAAKRALFEVAVGVERLCADKGRVGPQLQDTLYAMGVSELIEIVPKSKGTLGVTVFSRLWVVERTFALMRC